MTPVATVLVPTHSHALTLPHAVRSALAQTEDRIEIVIIGDGVDEPTREAAQRLASGDPRVRFEDRPKGPRHGEPYRHELLQTASGRLVFYLSDDDLWMPDHVATLRDLVDESGADFVNALTIGRLDDGTLVKLAVDLSQAGHRELMNDGFNWVGLSSVAHTLEAYRRLPHGWRAAPKGTPTDLHMWHQWFAEDWPRYASATRPTVLNFPSGQRKDVSAEDRVRELEEFEPALRDPGARLAFLEQVIADDAPRSAWLETHYRSLQKWLEQRDEALRWHAERLDEAAAEHERHLTRIAELEQQVGQCRADADRATAELETRNQELAAMRASLRWRVGERVASLTRRS
jgi:GalNAc5-diNAcBac-PP-undecaprenol beta-1,3-glucosyltransferase